MRLSTVVLSVGLHIGLAVGLVAVAQKKELRRRAISVAVQDEKKKAKPPKPPAPPKPIVHREIAKVEPVAPKAVSAAPVAHTAAAAPVAMNLAMSNAGLDVGPGIGLEGRAKPTAAPVKVASAISERRTQRTRDEAGGGSADAPCAEEPTKPEAIVKTPLDYTLYPQAQADGLEGKFKARLTIDADGQVTSVEVTGSIDTAFDAAIVAALQRWRFKPAMACGKAVAGGTYVVSRTFELGD